MGNGDLKYLIAGDELGYRRMTAHGFEVDIFADKLLVGIAEQYAGQETRFAKNLEAVADSPDQSASVGKLDHSLHDGRKPCNGSCPKIITIGKSTGQHNAVGGFEVIEGRFFVPDFFDLLPHDLAQYVYHIIIAIGTRENNNTKFHA